jgi:hypothetical protein
MMIDGKENPIAKMIGILSTLSEKNSERVEKLLVI